MKSAYIHIPFCEHICHYCDFNKYFIQSQPVDEYLNALEQEMINTIAKTGQPDLKTIFIGGGTPTSLSEEQLKKLMDMINRVLKPSSDLSEFAVEANPDDLSAEKLKILKEAGVNRLSFGVQTFEDDLLEKIGRVHKQKMYSPLLKERGKSVLRISVLISCSGFRGKPSSIWNIP